MQQIELPTEDSPARVLVGDALETLRRLPADYVQCCVTSPPYWALRDYGMAGQIGLESTPDAFVGRLVDVFEEVRRVLHPSGTCWVNMGDSYASQPAGNAADKPSGFSQKANRWAGGAVRTSKKDIRAGGLKPKDLVGIPWRLAFALQAAGWWLRSDIIWHKPSPMPESVTDRPTKAHEYVFLLSKRASYYYDAEAVREAAEGREWLPNRANPISACPGGRNRYSDGSSGYPTPAAGRNRRSVWTIASEPYPEAHFATFPCALVEPMIKAGSRPGDLVLDPFAGSGTALAVAVKLKRRALGIELNPEYARLAEKRLAEPLGTGGLFDTGTPVVYDLFTEPQA